MPAQKTTAPRANRICLTRNGRVLTLTIEGDIALLIAGVVALTYLIHPFH